MGATHQTSTKPERNSPTGNTTCRLGKFASSCVSVSSLEARPSWPTLCGLPPKTQAKHVLSLRIVIPASAKGGIVRSKTCHAKHKCKTSIYASVGVWGRGIGQGWVGSLILAISDDKVSFPCSLSHPRQSWRSNRCGWLREMHCPISCGKGLSCDSETVR